MSTNAREYLDEIADMLRSKGRAVEITETEESFGTFVWMYSPAPHWYDRTFSLNAARSTSTGRWRLGDLNVGSSVGRGKAFKRSSRSDIRIAAEVYA